MGPVIEAGPLELTIIKAETEWFDQGQWCPEGSTGSRHIAGVRWNPRLKQGDAQSRSCQGLVHGTGHPRA